MKRLNIIKKIEKENNIKTLFLIESGSRAWGWESKDSDYDIRGVFIQDYLSLDYKYQINKKVKNLDIELWDLKKFLNLFKKSNPTCWEWLSSDIIYKDSIIRLILSQMFSKNFSKYSLKKHYVSMARQNFEKYIKISDKANLKKYVYILRSIACVNYIEENKTPPPKNYTLVLLYLPENVREFFVKIINDKRKSEKLKGKRNRDVENYIVSYFNKVFKVDKSKFDDIKLNNILKEYGKM